MTCPKINTNIGTGCMPDFQTQTLNDEVNLINKSIADAFKDCDSKLFRIDNKVNRIELFYEDKHFANVTWGYESNTGSIGVKFVVTTEFI